MRCVPRSSAPPASHRAPLLRCATCSFRSAWSGPSPSRAPRAVRIQGHTSEQIRAATVVVFQQDGYTAVDVHRAEMVFEKPGSRWDRIAHGSWIDEAPVAVRVRVSVVPVSDGAFDLRCQAFRVRHTGEAVFEEQVPLKADQNKEFQDLLDKVPGRLAQ